MSVRGTHLVVDLQRITENARKVKAVCEARGVEVLGVTKGVSAEEHIVSAILAGGITKLADARLENVFRLRRSGFRQPITLLRIPMLSQAELVTSACDCSLNSEPEVLRALSDAALSLGRLHEVILMIDVGDLREGVAPEDAPELLRRALPLKGVRVAGIGTNMGCYGGILPTEKNLTLLCQVAGELERVAGEPLDIISGGGTSSLMLTAAGQLPSGVNQIRVGEGILLGTDSTFSRSIPWLNQDTFILRAEIVELKRKPTVPIGERGAAVFSDAPAFEDQGIRRRAIVALGQQDVPPSGVIPVDPAIRVLGASSDHMILDIEDSEESYALGDMVDLRLNYQGLLMACSSAYIPHVYLCGDEEPEEQILTPEEAAEIRE
ncbi:MAG: alanine/ornithine racemase family PLP-dependent enzyme [Oscillospiraceae bacterium]|nr:alanine/ornithine racemase family PLP-dependent enzyme [Oscillospiraceae bacterium]